MTVEGYNCRLRYVNNKWVESWRWDGESPGQQKLKLREIEQKGVIAHNFQVHESKKC